MSKTTCGLLFDSSVLFDIQNASIFGYVSIFPHKLLVTDIILSNELETIEATTLLNFGFQSVQLNPEEMSALQSYRICYNALSIGDLSCLVYAENNNNIMIVAGDRDLRALALQKHIRVHGSLWILDELIEHGIMPTPKAVTALELMLEHGARLPKHECDMRLRIWNG